MTRPWVAISGRANSPIASKYREVEMLSPKPQIDVPRLPPVPALSFRFASLPRAWHRNARHVANLAVRPWLRASSRTVICVTALRLSFGAADPASISSSRCSRPALGCPNALSTSSQCSHASHGKPNQGGSRMWPAIACRLMTQQLNRPSGRLNAGIGLLSPASPGSRYPDHEQFKRPAWDEHTISSSHDVATDSTSAIPTRACFWARMAAPARDPLLMPPPNAEASRTV